MNASRERRPAVLFDVDGTLVDSNYLHVHAWQRAFHDLRIDADSWRIHRSIGMDGSALISALAGEVDDGRRKRLKELHTGYYLESSTLLRLLPGARQLLKRVKSLGLQVVLATSAPEDELAMLRKLLDSEEILSVVTSAGDVETAKPAPDIVEVALQRAGVTARNAVFVGDSRWDAEASARAGVLSVGLLSGGISREELDSAGTSCVYTDAADLEAHIAASPIADLADRVE